MTAATDRNTALTAAMTAAAAAIAFQVAGKATRDALFLANFPVTALPGMMMLSAALAVPAILYASYAMGRATPARAIPVGFLGSAVVVAMIWALSVRFEHVAAIVLFLYLSVSGPVLISGFWTVVNERFDPRTAKRHIGRIGAFATLGGLGGGLAANRLAAAGLSGAMLPLLALLHAGAAFAVVRIGAPQGFYEPTEDAAEGEGMARMPELLAGLNILRRVPYLRSLAALIVVSVIGEAVLDYIFKQQATVRFHSRDDLLNLFSAFQVVASLIAFTLQNWVSRPLLQRSGIGPAVAALPAGVAVGGLGVLFAPGLVSAIVARGVDTVLRNSLFKSGYELLFSPVTPRDKRGTKALVDVGGSRLGDALGGGLVLALLALGPLAARALPAAAIVLALACLVIVWSLHRGYVKALEARLISGAGRIGADAAEEEAAHPALPVAGLDQTRTIDVAELRAHLQAAGELPASESAGAPGAAARPLPDDVARLGARIAALRASDPARVRRALHAGPVDAGVVPHVIPLLDNETMAAEAVAVLQAEMPGITGQLTDFLVDPRQPLQVRRRIPRILATVPSWRAVQGLFAGLEDRRFEVRVQAGCALARLHERAPEQQIDRERVFEVVRREVAVERRIWEGQREIDLLETDAASPFQDEYLRRRAHASLEHVFTLLSLALPTQPLRLAYQGLHTSDEILRGMALEYLESVLPADVRQKLWPFIEKGKYPRHAPREREEILNDLLRSNESIRINLAELRKLEEG